MTKPHRLTPEQWQSFELYAEDNAYDACFLELRARIEALEATQHAHVDTLHLTDAVRKQIREELARPAAWRSLKVATESTYGDAKTVPLFTAEEVARIVAPSSPANSLVDRVATDAELCQVHNDAADHAGSALRAVYDLGRQHGAAPIRSGPESPLVERVADAIAAQATSAGIVNDRPARAAILEVAAWLRERGGYPCSWIAQTLERQANRTTSQEDYDRG
jgi:hypothetical protein